MVVRHIRIPFLYEFKLDHEANSEEIARNINKAFGDDAVKE